jgi:hypothetical protein
MSKTRIGRRASNIRSARRSLVELTAAAVSSAARDGVRATSPAPIATLFEGVKAGETAAQNSDQLITSIMVAPPAAGHGDAAAVLSSSARAVSNSANGTTDMAVKAVEDHRASVLQNLKVCVSASPGDMKVVASPELPSDPALEPATQEANSSHGAASAEKTIPATTIAATVADYQAKAFLLTEVNMSAALDYAQQLVNLRSASDFIKLSSTHARIQIELMIKQSSELRSLAMNLTPSHDTRTAADPQVLTKSTDRP